MQSFWRFNAVSRLSMKNLVSPHLVRPPGVLKRAETLRATGLDTADVDRFLDDFIAHAHAVDVHIRYRPSVRDPDDEMFMELAINGGAEALVSFNVGDYRPADRRFGGPDILVCRPGDILRRLTWRPSAISHSGCRRP